MKLQAQIINTKKSGSSPVYVVCYIGGERCRFLTGVEVLPGEWDQPSGTVTSRTKEAKDKNLFINNIKKRITEIEIKYRLQNKRLSPELLRNEFELPSYEISFYSFYEMELKKRRGVLSDSTFEKYEITLKKMKRFREQLNFCDLDQDFINDYKHYCKSLGNCQNSINANLKNIKFFSRLAYKKNITNVNLFDDIKISSIIPDRNFLTELELNKLLNYFNLKRFPEKELKVLRPFLFACYTGLRISDVENFKFDNIVNDIIVIQPIKTKYISKIIRIPLCETAKKLIEFDRKTRHVFSLFSEQYINRKLKEICKAAGIYKPITFHYGRHTFATNYLRKTRDLAGLQKLLGHKNISETMIYAHALDDDVQTNIMMLDQVS